MKMDFTAKDLQRRIEEVKNDNDPAPILYEKIKSYDNSEARRHINLPSVLSETKKTITDLVLRNYCFGEDFSISSLSRLKIKKKSFKAKHHAKAKERTSIRNTMTNTSIAQTQKKKKVLFNSKEAKKAKQSSYINAKTISRMNSISIMDTECQSVKHFSKKLPPITSPRKKVTISMIKSLHLKLSSFEDNSFESSSVLQHHQAKFSVIKMSERDNNNDEDYR